MLGLRGATTFSLGCFADARPSPRSSLATPRTRRVAVIRNATGDAAGTAEPGKVNKDLLSKPFKFEKDTETLEDVMAFTGVAPERINGRIAMIGFVAAAAAEKASGKSVLQQLAAAPVGVVLFMLLISAASVIPKFSAGVPLGDLIEAAGRDGLPKELRFFNKTHEVWVGRVAMLGFLGLVVVEGFKGGALF